MPTSMLKSSPVTPPASADYDDETDAVSDVVDDVMQVEQKAVNFTNWLLVRARKSPIINVTLFSSNAWQ